MWIELVCSSNVADLMVGLCSLMMEAHNAAMAPRTCDCGPFSLDHAVGSRSDGSPKTVCDVLKDKHPSGRAADPT